VEAGHEPVGEEDAEPGGVGPEAEAELGEHAEDGDRRVLVVEAGVAVVPAAQHKGGADQDDGQRHGTADEEGRRDRAPARA